MHLLLFLSYTSGKSSSKYSSAVEVPNIMVLQAKSNNKVTKIQKMLLILTFH
nr:MAG TPA: hypothetical protein [Caudoviricetes sp.]